MEEGKGVITYAVTKFVNGGKSTVVQELDGFPVNEYDAYENGSFHNAYFTLYPNRRIIPSTVPLVKHTVKLSDTRRKYT